MQTQLNDDLYAVRYMLYTVGILNVNSNEYKLQAL